MKKEELHAIAQAAAKNITTEHDLTELTKMLSKITIEAALNAEWTSQYSLDTLLALQCNSKRGVYEQWKTVHRIIYSLE